jgi:hypothetical protein
MEKVKCLKCGSIGYTASPEQVPCYKCGSKYKLIRLSENDPKKIRRENICES